MFDISSGIEQPVEHMCTSSHCHISEVLFERSELTYNNQKLINQNILNLGTTIRYGAQRLWYTWIAMNLCLSGKTLPLLSD